MTATTTTEAFEEQEPAAGRVDPRLKYLERRLLEAFDELWDSFVDPAEAVCDVDGTPWSQLGGGPLAGGGSVGMAFANEQQLAAIRDQCRALAVANEFAINGHENRISYIVGSGHVYRAVARKGRPPTSRCCGTCRPCWTSSSG